MQAVRRVNLRAAVRDLVAIDSPDAAAALRDAAQGLRGLSRTAVAEEAAGAATAIDALIANPESPRAIAVFAAAFERLGRKVQELCDFPVS